MLLTATACGMDDFISDFTSWHVNKVVLVAFGLMSGSCVFFFFFFLALTGNRGDYSGCSWR